MSIFRDVADFHEKMGILPPRHQRPRGCHPPAPMQGRLSQDACAVMAKHLRHWRHLMLVEGTEAASRFAWIFEELAETLEAHAEGDLVEEIDGRLDLIYFLAGDLDFMNVPHAVSEAAWAEVHRANMAKTPQRLGADRASKIIKPDGWEPPRLAELLGLKEER